jgi:hypothetical protein
MIQAGLYRIRPKLNIHYALARNEDADHGLRTTLHDMNRTLHQLTVFRLEPGTDNKYPTSFFIRLACNKFTNEYIRWEDKAKLTFGKKNESDGLHLFKFDYADNNWPNNPSIRDPEGKGWMFIGNPVSGANVDVAGDNIVHEGPVVGWGFNGGDNQQWYIERMPESVQQEIDQSGWH